MAAVRDNRAPAVPGEQGRAAMALAVRIVELMAAVNINLAIAERARAGESLSVAEIDELGTSDVLSLGMLADEVRRARVGEQVTFVRVLELAGAEGAVKGAEGAEVETSPVAGDARRNRGADR